MNKPLCRSTQRLTRLCALILSLAALALGFSSAYGQTVDYTGQGINGNFSNSSNWTPSTPANGDDLVFGTVNANQLTAHNNSAVTTLDSITFQDITPGTGQSFTVNGSAISLTQVFANAPAISNTSSANQTVSFGTITLSNNSQSFTTGNANLTVTSKITLNLTTLALESGTGQIILSGNISGTGNSGASAIFVGDAHGPGNVTLSGNNSGLSTSVALFNGTLTIANNNALGTADLAIGGGTNTQILTTDQSRTIKNNIDVYNNFTVAPVGTLKVNGALILESPNVTITNSTGQSNGLIQLNGGITGTVGNLILQGVGNSANPSEFIISGGTASTYTGSIEVGNSALLDLNVNPAHGAITGNLTIDAGSQVTTEQNNELSTSTVLTVNGTFTMNGHTETIAGLSGDNGTVDMGTGGKLIINSSSNSTFGNPITGGIIGTNSQLVKDGTGTFTLQAKSTYTGKTTINGGTFAAGGFFVLDDSSHYVVNSGGTLAIMGRSNAIGSLSGSGIVENGDSSTASLAVGDDNSNRHFSGTIEDGGSGAFGLIKDGSGKLRLSGDNTYSGGTLLTDGTLIAASSTALGTGDVTVIGGTLRSNYIAAPNNIYVGGNYDQTFGGTLQLRVYAPFTNANDTMVVEGGTVTLGQGATLNLTFPLGSGAVDPSVSYDLIHNAAGGITGTFGTVDGLSNFTLPPGYFSTLDYTKTDVTLLFRQYLGLTPGLTPNQATIADVLDRYENVNTAGSFGKIVDGLYSLNTSAVGGALDQLSPEQFAKFTSVTAFNNASFETQAMDDYLNGQRSGPNGTFLSGNGSIDSSGLTLNDPDYDPSLAMVHSRLLAWNPAPYENGLLSDSDSVLGGVEMKDSKDMKQMASGPAYNNPWNFFVRGNVILAQGFSQTDVGHFDDNTESVVLGTDYRICPNFLVGLTAGYAHTDVTLDNNGSSATVDSYSPGIYAAWADKGWYANLTGSYTHNAYTESRVIGYLGQTANGAPGGNEGVANIDGGYDFHKGAFTFGPLVGLQYTHLTVDGYNESGSDANLSVNDDQSDSLRSRLGGRFSFNMTEGGINITPHLDASWQHEFLDQSRGVTSQFDNFSSGAFSVRTNSPSRDSALVDAGVNIDVSKTMTVFADYMVQAGQDNYFGQSVQGGVKIGF